MRSEELVSRLRQRHTTAVVISFRQCVVFREVLLFYGVAWYRNEDTTLLNLTCGTSLSVFRNGIPYSGVRGRLMMGFKHESPELGPPKIPHDIRTMLYT